MRFSLWTKKWVPTIIALAIGFGIGYYFFYKPVVVNAVDPALRDPNSDYKFVNPLFLCSSVENKSSTKYKALDTKISDLIGEEKAKGHLVDASVYFRDLVSGRWLGINENQQYAPASLLKVPTMIALYKYAETDPNFLEKTVAFTDALDENAMENFKPSSAIVMGKKYSVPELIRYMIDYSDNNARRMLHYAIDEKWVDEVYTDLGLSFVNSTEAVDFMSAKQYSYFFRILYNGSYITRADSEKALSLLTQTDFKQGIVAGVPTSMPVAHKFGERKIISNSTPTADSTELHDCGIVYYPTHPYLLCVMTKGKNFDDLSGVIKSISAAIYSEESASK